jgi:hypothetical protein
MMQPSKHHWGISILLSKSKIGGGMGRQIGWLPPSPPPQTSLPSALMGDKGKGKKAGKTNKQTSM